MHGLTLYKKICVYTLVFLSIFISTLSFSNTVSVEGATTNSLQDLQKQREELQKKLDQIAKDKADANNKLNAAKSQKSGVEREISVLTIEINQQQLVIDEKETEIAQKENEIAILEDQIAALKKTLNNLDIDINEKKVLADKRLQNIYKVSLTKTAMTLFFNAVSADDLLAKLKYQNLLRNKDEETLGSLKADKEAYNTQKKEMEEKRTSVQTLTDSIIAQKVELENAKNVLSIKKSENQVKLASLSSQVGFQQNAYNNLSSEQKSLEDQISLVQAQIFSQFRAAPGTGQRILSGQYIGEMGCTGYCTGSHLHFFAAFNTSYSTNPCNFLPSGKFSFCGTSSPKISWPMKNPFVWSRGFNSSHGAIDIVATGSDKGIYSAHDGWLYRGVEKCEVWKSKNPYAYSLCINNGPAQYAIVCENKDNCNTGMKTGYWHLKKL